MCDVLFKDPNYTWFLFICYIYHVPVIKKYLTDINVPIKKKKKKIQDGSQNLVLKINASLHFTQKFKMAAKNGGKDTLQLKNFIKITISRTVCKINVFLRFTQKFKMAAKSGEKVIFGEKSPVDYADTLWVPNFIENHCISHPFQDKCVFAFNTEIQDGH